MSNLSDGDKPEGKGPNPRRRRRRRSADRRTREDSSQNANVAIDDVGPPEHSANGQKRRSAGNEDGSGNPAGNDESIRDSGDGSARKNFSKKKRRFAGRGKNKPRYDGMRNLRSVPRKTPDAGFSSTPSGEPQGETKEAGNGGESFRKRRGRGRPKSLYAALDLGTNNCRLLIAMPQERGRFRVVDGFSRIVRLGEGLSQTGELGQAAMDRAVEALKVCAEKLQNRNIRRQRLIATEACRQAKNGELFLERVKNEAGLDLEIVSRETEARLATEGCGSLMDRKSDGAVLFDIGGGSSELILIDSTSGRKRRISDRIVAWTSLPMGVVTLAERFGGQNVSRRLFDEMVADVMVHIDAFDGREALNKVFKHGRVHLLGTSGTVTTLAGIHLDLPRYDRRRVDGVWLSSEDVDAVIDRLLGMAYEERAKNPCIGQERADLVLAGCAILNAIRLTWPTNRLRVADRGLREGLLAEMMNGDGAWIKRRKNRWNSSRRGGENKGNMRPNHGNTGQ